MKIIQTPASANTPGRPDDSDVDDELVVVDDEEDDVDYDDGDSIT